MEGRGSRGWWDLKVAKRVASALWSSGELAIRERKNFLRTYDLAERVIPEKVRRQRVTKNKGVEMLLLKALDGHGWATMTTLTGTWRPTNIRKELVPAAERLERRGEIVRASLENPEGKPTPGWIRPSDLELVDRLRRVRPQRDRGVLLSPFDPVLWDRPRVQRLFGFDQILEIYKPQSQRTYGYYCMPVLAGERLVARFDFKADRKAGVLRVLSCHHEGTGTDRPASAEDGEAAATALQRHANALELEIVGWKPKKATAKTKRTRAAR